MNILVIEDEESKRIDIVDFLSIYFDNPDVTSACSYHSGLEAILARRFDLMLFDMTLVTFDVTGGEDGGAPRPYAGRELLSQIDRHAITANVIVVTQHDRFSDGSHRTTLAELDAQLKFEYPTTYLGAVHYSSTEDWRDELRELLQKLPGER